MMGQALGRRLDRLSEGRFAVVAVAPGLLLVALVVIPPLLAALGLSLFRIELLRDDITPFVGLRNYATRLPADAAFLSALPRTVLFSVIVTLIAVPVALGTALLIARSSVRTATVLWLFLVVPWAIAPVASGIFWRMQFDAQTGIVNLALRSLGLPTVALDTATGSLVALGVAVVWRAVPLLGVLFLGALRGVPRDIGRAARMDGAGSWQAFRHITLPVIRPTIIAACVIQVVLTMQVFDVQFALAPPIPPRGAELAGFAVYQSVTGDISLGYGATLAVTVGVVTAIVAGGLVLISRIRLPSLRIDRGTARADVASDDMPAGPSASRPAWTADRGSSKRRIGVPLRARRLATAAATLLLVVWLVGPVLWIVVASTQLERHLVLVPPRIGLPLTIDAYAALLKSEEWRAAAITTVAITTIATAVALVIASATAYPLSRYRLRGGGALALALLGTQLIPPIALAFPALLIFIKLGLRNTIPGLVLVHAAFWTPILVWLLRSAFGSVPRELERAARMDGASRLGAIVRVVLPAAAPMIAAAAAIVFIGIWNDFIFAVLIGGRDTQTLPRWLGESQSPLIHVLAARIVLTVAPCVVLLLLFRRRIAALL
jgi:ABC-type glycerol-3-phosphate transport system permease component